jgi:hypothetical protein
MSTKGVAMPADFSINCLIYREMRSQARRAQTAPGATRCSHLLVGTIHKLLIVHRLGLLRLRRSYAASYAGRRPSTSVPPFSLLTLNGLSTYFATLIGIA